MPIVRIDITGPKDTEYCSAVLSGVRSAISELGAPDDRVTVRLIQIPAEQVDVPACRTDRFTIVDVMLYPGRTPEMKAACVAALRENLSAAPGIPACEISVAFHDMDPADLDVLPGEAHEQ